MSNSSSDGMRAKPSSAPLQASWTSATLRASARAFLPQAPVLRYEAVSPSASRFIGIWQNCIVAPPWRNSTA